jgi:hypothetical protein
MRKIPFLLCFLLVILLMAPNGLCNDVYPTIRTEELEGYVGDILEVVVFFENPARISGGEFVLVYDPSVVEPREVKRGNLTKTVDGFLFLSNPNYSENSIKVSWVGLKEISSAGTLSVITFYLKEEGSTELVMAEPLLTDKEGARVNLATVNGSIAVLPESLGEGSRNNQESFSHNAAFGILVLAAMAGALFWKHRKGSMPANKERKL